MESSREHDKVPSISMKRVMKCPDYQSDHQLLKDSTQEVSYMEIQDEICRTCSTPE